MCNQNKNKCVTKKGEQMTPPKGRPPSRSPKNVDTRIMLSEEEAKMLKFCSEQTGMTKADIIRRGIKKIYDEIVLGKFDREKK